MTTDDRLVSGASSESSLPPNKSSGDIGERLRDIPHYLMILPTIGMPDQVTVGALAHEAAAEIERLRRERDEARTIVVEANNSLYGSQGYFHSTNGGPFDKYHLARPIEELKSRARDALTAESAVAAAWEEAAKIAEAKALEFLSPEYATGQPLSSFNERFACEQVASAIRAAGAEKTVESGHSPSTHNGAMSL